MAVLEKATPMMVEMFASDFQVLSRISELQRLRDSAIAPLHETSVTEGSSTTAVIVTTTALAASEVQISPPPDVDGDSDLEAFDMETGELRPEESADALPVCLSSVSKMTDADVIKCLKDKGLPPSSNHSTNRATLTSHFHRQHSVRSHSLA